MAETEGHIPNTFFVEVAGAGLPEVDGLYVPSTAPPVTSDPVPFPVLGIGTGNSHGIVLMENRFAVPHCHIQTATSRGAFAAWMVILRTT